MLSVHYILVNILLVHCKIFGKHSSTLHKEGTILQIRKFSLKVVKYYLSRLIDTKWFCCVTSKSTFLYPKRRSCVAKGTALRNRHYRQHNAEKKVVNSHPAESSLDYLRFHRITLEMSSTMLSPWEWLIRQDGYFPVPQGLSGRQ